MLTLGLAVLVLPLLALIAAAEGLLLQRLGRNYDWKAYWATSGIALGRIVAIALIKVGLATMVLAAVAEWRIATLAMDRWWHWAALFIGLDFCYYWMHRAEHRIHWFWLNHSVHHSPNEYTLSAAYRLGWTGRITGAAVCLAPLVWVGFPVALTLSALAANLLYQFWLHTELIGKLPRPLEFLLNTPAHHRVHHGSNPEYIDCNYGGVLIVFDRLFGTFRSERADAPIRYGLVEPIRSYNPFRIVLHAWVGMLRGLRAAHGWRQRAKVVFGPPEFKPREH